MNTQNVSAQLYEKLLPDQSLTYNCKTDPTLPYLETCFDPVDSDKKIENAFQGQLDLSEYYKSPEVFNKMKQTYYDQTMEGEVNNQPIVEVRATPVLYNSSDTILNTVGPRDYLEKNIKESFGSSMNGTNFYYVLAFIVFVFILYYLIKF